MSERKSKKVEEIRKQIGDLEKKLNNRIEEPENRIREWTRPDSVLWYLETFTIVVSNIFVGCLIASVTAIKFEKIAWGIATIMFGFLFSTIRLIAGRRIQAPQRFMIGVTFFSIVTVYAGIMILVLGMIQVGWINLN